MRRKRKDNEWTLDDMATRIAQIKGSHVSGSFLHQIEMGQAEPRELDLVLAIEELLDIRAERWRNFRGLSRFLNMRGAA